MSYVIFENDGEMDLRAVKTFGVSAKVNQNPIGFFGTGLKYALAILLREGVPVSLLVGGKTYRFDASNITMRDKEFMILTMNGEELPFTTHLGSKWEMWQAFRELYCNCLDESGKVYVSDVFPRSESSANKTLIVVDADDSFMEQFNRKDEIVLRLSDMLKINADPQGVEIYNVGNKAVYYRGVRVKDFGKPSMFTYNILKNMELTEDRTLKFGAMQDLATAVTLLTDRNAIRKIITASDDFAEREFQFLSWGMLTANGTSSEFDEVLGEEYRSNNDKLNRTARDMYQRKINASAAKHYVPSEMTTVEMKQFDRALGICCVIWSDFSDYKILIVKDLGKETMALADAEARTIVLSKRTFGHGTKYLVSTMIEEYMHLKTGFDDCTRSLQTHLFDTICTMIENHIIEEPI